MKTMNRRTFLKSTALSTAAFSLPAYSWASVRGANETIRVAIVGFGGRGQDHISGMRGLAGKNVRVVALCDVDSKILDAGVESFSKRNEKVEGYRDIRKLLENKEVDAITIATPNHWHSLATIWAVQAGKDVYVEKPVSHNVREGRKIVEAARKYGRIVQTGTQSRSSFAIKEAIEWVRAGNLGKIKIARGLCYKRRPSIGKVDARPSSMMVTSVSPRSSGARGTEGGDCSTWNSSVCTVAPASTVRASVTMPYGPHRNHSSTVDGSTRVSNSARSRASSSRPESSRASCGSRDSTWIRRSRVGYRSLRSASSSTNITLREYLLP